MTFKRITVLLTAVLALTLLAACATAPSAEKDGDKLVVYTSFYPMYDFALKAAGNAAEIHCLIPDGTEPHDWEPSPRDMAGLEEADLFFYSGAGFEDWVQSVLSGLNETGPQAIETSAGIALLDGDPHIWLAPKNAKLQFETMCEAMKTADPANAGVYEENRARWSDEFDKLDTEYKQLLKFKNRHIVVTHGAFGYLCEAYDLKQLAAEGYSPDSEPDPARMAKLIDEARRLGIKVLFYEEPSSIKTAEAIARELGARTEALSPLEGLSEEDRSNGGDYFSVMRKNLAVLKEALE